MLRNRRLHTALFAAFLVVASATIGGVAFGQLTATESSSLQTETASAITTNDSTDGDGNWSQPRANAGRTGVTSDDGPMPYGNVSWSTGQTGWTPGPIIVGDTVVAAYAGDDSPIGHVEGYNATTGDRVWNRTDVGTPRGAPTSLNGTVYLSTYPQHGWEFPDRFSEGRTGLFALDAETGALEWHWNESVSSPLASDGRLYVGLRTESPTVSRNLTAVDPADGQRIWTSDVQGRPLAVADGRLIVGNETDNRLIAIDPADGSLLWETDVDPAVVLHENVVATADGVYLTTGQLGNPDTDSATERLVKYAADTGVEEWRRDLTGNMTSSIDDNDRITAPAVSNGTVYVVTSDEVYPSDTRHGTVHALDAATGDHEWRWHTKARLTGAPAVANGTVYTAGIYSFGDGQAGDRTRDALENYPNYESDVTYALDATTGTEHWNVTGRDFLWLFGPDGLAVEDGRLYVVVPPNMGGGTYSIQAITPTDRNPPWYYHALGDQNFTSPNRAPDAAVDAEAPADGVRYAPNTTVTLDGSNSNDVGGSIVSYEWDLDDDGQYETTGETATVRSSSVPCGIIRVTLRVTDDDGETDTETVIIQTEGA